MEDRSPESETAFVIVPHDSAKNQFVIVQDKNESGDVFENKEKWPGGRREINDPTLAYTAVREALEEAGLDIFPPTEELLEVHKPSVWDGGENTIPSVHRDIFFESQPPIDNSFFVSGDRSAHPNYLVPGSEIEKVIWMSNEKILEDIRRRKFFPNHAAAFFWRSIRERYLKTRDPTLLYPITRRKNLHWRVRDGVLVFCFYNGCPLCRQYEKNISQRIFDDAPREIKEEQISGLVKFLIIRQDKFFDYIYLLPVYGTNATFQLFFKTVKGEALPANEVADKVAREYGWNVEFLESRKVYDHFLILLQLKSGSKLLSELLSDEFCINKHPPLIFLEDDREWREICEAITDFNKKREKKIYIHHSWWIQKNPKIVKTST